MPDPTDFDLSNSSNEPSNEGKSLRELLAPKLPDLHLISSNKQEPPLPDSLVETGPIIKENELKEVLNEVKLNKAVQREELQHRANAILAQHDWQESNVPMNSEYWSIVNSLRSLR